HHLERHTGRSERLRLLAAATEDERVAALETHHALTLARKPHEQRVDLILTRGWRAAALPHVVQFRVGPHRAVSHDARIHQRVVHHGVRGLEQRVRTNRQETWIAWTCA